MLPYMYLYFPVQLRVNRQTLPYAGVLVPGSSLQPGVVCITTPALQLALLSPFTSSLVREPKVWWG